MHHTAVSTVKHVHSNVQRRLAWMAGAKGTVLVFIACIASVSNRVKWRELSNGGKNQNPKKSLGLQTKPKKIPGPKFNPQKLQCQISQPWKFPESIKWYNYYESSNCFENNQKSVLKSSYPKKYLLKLSYSKKILKSKIWDPKKSFDHPCHLKSGVPLLGLFRIVMCHWILVYTKACILFIAI